MCFNIWSSLLKNKIYTIKTCGVACNLLKDGAVVALTRLADISDNTRGVRPNTYPPDIEIRCESQGFTSCHCFEGSMIRNILFPYGRRTNVLPISSRHNVPRLFALSNVHQHFIFNMTVGGGIHKGVYCGHTGSQRSCDFSLIIPMSRI